MSFLAWTFPSLPLQATVWYYHYPKGGQQCAGAKDELVAHVWVSMAHTSNRVSGWTFIDVGVESWSMIIDVDIERRSMSTRERVASFPGSPGTRIYIYTPAQLQCSCSRAWEPGNEARNEAISILWSHSQIRMGKETVTRASLCTLRRDHIQKHWTCHWLWH